MIISTQGNMQPTTDFPSEIVQNYLFLSAVLCDLHCTFQFLRRLGVCRRAISLLTPQGIVGRQYAAATVKPFKYQDILEFESAPDIPWRKLTGMSHTSTCFVIDRHRTD